MERRSYSEVSSKGWSLQQVNTFIDHLTKEHGLGHFAEESIKKETVNGRVKFVKLNFTIKVVD